MLNYIISTKGIKISQIVMLVISILLLLLNIVFFVFEKSGDSILVMCLTLLFVSILNYLGNLIYQIHFLGEDILISNFFYGETKYSVTQFDEITTVLAMGGIYKLNLKNGKSYSFSIDKNILAKNLFNIDSGKYAKQLTDEIRERINLSHK